MGRHSLRRQKETNELLRDMMAEIREEPLDRRDIWEYMWKNDPDGGATKSTSYSVRLFATKNWPVLDVACGSGLYLRLPKGSWYVGMDVSWEALKVASERNKDAHYVQADAAYSPFREGAFVRAFSFNGIDFIGQYFEKAVKELIRVTKPGGVVKFTMHHSDLLIAHGIDYLEWGRGKLFAIGNPLYQDMVYAGDIEGIETLVLEQGAKKVVTSFSTAKSEEGIGIMKEVQIKAIKR